MITLAVRLKRRVSSESKKRVSVIVRKGVCDESVKPMKVKM